MLLDKWADIKNIKLLDNKHYTEKNMLYYEKHFKYKGVDFIEYYFNDQLDSYQTSFKNDNVKIIRSFGENKKMFAEEKIYYFKDTPYWCSEKIFNMDGSEYYISEPIIGD